MRVGVENVSLSYRAAGVSVSVVSARIICVNAIVLVGVSTVSVSVVRVTDLHPL